VDLRDGVAAGRHGWDDGISRRRPVGVAGGAS
jgi:hypothetical protein